MEHAPKADMDHAKVALFDYDDAPTLEELDRSTLDHWATCPWQAAAIESGKVKTVGMAAEAGEAIHNALATVTKTWVQDGDQYETTWAARDFIKTDLEFELRRSRPDLQPEVLAGMMPSLWAWAKFLSEIRPGNVLAFDGGDDVGRSSQLAYDMPDLGARVTSELDLLHACRESTEVILWVDYKTGHETHDIYDVAKSFQFQMHAMLILHHYKDVQEARLKVWDTRLNRVTYAVTFPRSRFHDYEWRVRSAVETRKRYRENPPAWPTLEGCRICPAAAICPVVDSPIKELASDPAAFIRDLVAVEARAKAMRDLAAAHVDATKQEIDAGGGIMFGRNKPKQSRKSEATTYTLKGESNGDGN